jgi:hypothetical protein
MVGRPHVIRGSVPPFQFMCAIAQGLFTAPPSAGAALTIWRWGRQRTVESALPLGSFEDWAESCRDPLLALGCCDPIERTERVNADDPSRRQMILELFDCWNASPRRSADQGE